MKIRDFSTNAPISTIFEWFCEKFNIICVQIQVENVAL